MKCPEAIIQYNANKAGCDTFDQMCLASSYSVEESMVSFKWWHKAFWGLLDAVYTNAYIIFKHWHKDISHHEFLMDLQALLVENSYGFEYVTRTVRSIEESHSKGLGSHVIMKTQGVSSHHCVVCLKKWHEGKKILDENAPKKWHARRTKYMCKECNKYMCIGNCFAEYHKILPLTRR